MTTVVHCKRAPYDTYIGRPSKWGNPFVIGRDGTREDVVIKYREWVQRQPHLMVALPEVRGKILGCWCAPEACHGHVLAELADGLPSRVASSDITSLAPHEVFTFGTNRAGKHGRGAAKTALKWGAITGQGDGLMGQTYGIETKGRNLECLSLREIGINVDRFARFAAKHPELTFLVTAIGTGLAKNPVSDIAPMFAEAAKLPNVHLPASFWEALNV